MKERRKFNILYVMGLLLVSVGVSYGTMYFYPIINNTNTDNTSSSTGVTATTLKEVTVTDNGIAEAVSKVYDSVVVITTYKNNTAYASGSGFIYEVKGEKTYIITNHHVVESGNSFKVTYTDGSTATAKLLGGDEYSDIAVLEVATKNGYESVTLGSSEDLKVGDTTFVVGAPLDNVYSWTVTRGIVSGKERLVQVSTSNYGSDYIMNVLQTDAAVNAGNSGGPLCNANGEVIGVVSAKISSTGVEGMGFAIPIETALDKALQIISGDSVQYPYLGISMINASEISSYSKYYSYLKGNNSNTGVLIANIEDNSSALKAGLEVGDIILKIGDANVSTIAYLRYELYKYKVGDKISITYQRGGKEYTTNIELSSSSKKL